MDYITVKTAPANDPILFAAADEWCRDINTADTALVNLLITAATVQVEKMTNRVMISRTLISYFDCFSSSRFEPLPFVELRRSPLIAIVNVTVNGDVLDSADYQVKDANSFARILFEESYTLDDDSAYSISVEYTAGYAVAANIPEGLITALKMLVLFWYENRGDVGTDGKMNIPNVMLPILKQYRIVNSYG